MPSPNQWKQIIPVQRGTGKQKKTEKHIAYQIPIKMMKTHNQTGTKNWKSKSADCNEQQNRETEVFQLKISNDFKNSQNRKTENANDPLTPVETTISSTWTMLRFRRNTRDPPLDKLIKNKFWEILSSYFSQPLNLFSLFFCFLLLH